MKIRCCLSRVQEVARLQTFRSGRRDGRAELVLDGQLAVVFRDRESWAHVRGCVRPLRGGLVRPVGHGQLPPAHQSGRYAQLTDRRISAHASRRASVEPHRARRPRGVQARGAHRAGRRH